nr:alpha/beta hydrolase [Micromonospora sp. DSM 115978]
MTFEAYDTQPDGVYDEFGMLADNAAETGLTLSSLPPGRRVTTDVGGGQRVSALLWGEGAPQIVFLHGGGQNAHTWDTVMLALGVPALAIDLPGHGHSDWRPDRDYSPAANAEAVARAVEAHAPAAQAVVGMSLGGLTTIRLAAARPELARRAVVVDVTPAVTEFVSQMTPAQREATALISGPRTYPSFEAMVAGAVAAAPHRSESSLRRGVLHNARPLPDGQWAWRYDQLDGVVGRDGPTSLWADVTAVTAPTMLVRGGRSAMVRDADVAEFARRKPGLRVVVAPEAGHSVQSDAPLLLADAVRSFVLT